MSKAKAKPEEIAVSLDIELSEPQSVSATIITQGDLHAAFYAAVNHDPRSQHGYLLADAEKAQQAIDLFNQYQSIAGGLKPGQAQKYNDLKRMVKGR